MTPLPLSEIRLNLRSHVSALWWIGFLYRKPSKVEEVAKALSRWQKTIVALVIYFHTFPYLGIFSAAGRWFLSSYLEMNTAVNTPDLHVWAWAIASVISGGVGIAFAVILTRDLGFALAFGLCGGLSVGLTGGIGFGFVGGLVFGLVGGIAFGLAVRLGTGFAGGIAFGLAIGLAGSIAGGVAYGLAQGLAFGLIGGLVGGLAFGLAGTLAIGLAVALAVGLVGNSSAGIATLIGFYFAYFRGFYFPFHFLWLWPRPRPGIYHFHPVAWDDLCTIPLPGLDRLLFAYAEHDHEGGECEIDRLIDEYPSQRIAALRARAILVTHRAAATTDLSRLDEVLAPLPEGKKGFLAETCELRRRVHEIVALQARLDTLDRAFLREPFATLLVKEIEMFEQQIAGFKAPLSTEMRRAARQWLKIARRQLEAARAAVEREPTRQVFRAGDPVNREQEAFVQRSAILGELERQVMLANGCPGLLVYGRRRMGKSTLVRNLGGFLPPQVRIVNLSMQQAAAFTSLPSLVELIAGRVVEVVHEVPAPSNDLGGLERFLGAAQQRLETEDRRLLLAIDEFENLDLKISEGVFPVDLLAVVRESIQTHRRIIWAFAGSHAVDELRHAPWTSYLVSARTIEVTPFEPAETRLLLTEPLKHSSLWRDAEADRPRFAPGFWGEGGIERIHAEAGGWPHLVQLVAETVVDLFNDTGGATVDDALFERALDRAVSRGNNVLIELLEKESHLPGEWSYLQAFRTAETQPPPDDEAVDRSLRRRRLVLDDGDCYRLRVPLMARWLRQRI